MIEGIDITGRICREDGKWKLQISGPAWALIDFARELRNEGGKGRLYLMLGNGPTTIDSAKLTEAMLFTEWCAEDWCGEAKKQDAD